MLLRQVRQTKGKAAWTLHTAKPGAVDGHRAEEGGASARKVGLRPGSWSIGRKSFQSAPNRMEEHSLPHTHTVDISFLSLLITNEEPLDVGVSGDGG